MASCTDTLTVPAQLSVAVTALIDAVGTSLAQDTVIFCGVPVIVGTVSSSTVIICDDVAAFPHTSVAVHVLVIV